MSSPAFRLATRLVLLWTRIYTWGLPAVPRDRRRGEIASDLWELEHDSDRGGDMASTFRVLARLLFGMPHDVGWRIEQGTVRRVALRSTVALATLAVVAIVLIDQALRPNALPRVQPAPPPDILTLQRKALLVPPPPPPPPRPGEDPNLWRRLLVPQKGTGAPR